MRILRRSIERPFPKKKEGHMVTIWLIPKDAEKPLDGRTKIGKEVKRVEKQNIDN